MGWIVEGELNMRLGNRKIELSGATYFIADIGANHDGQIERAKN